MTQEELNVILEKYKKWLKNEEGGECADLHGVNLSNADLSCANLSCAILSNANLSNADLSCADLRYANLRYANLRSADLRYAKNLDYAYIRLIDLNGAITK